MSDPKSHNTSPSLDTILAAADGKVESRKLTELKTILECAIGSPLAGQSMDDPILVRCRLVQHLRDNGTRPGRIQAIEQLFMGIVRRAALQGIVLAPPEGPWTRVWQSVLDLAASSRGGRAAIRSLGAWATARGLAPDEIDLNSLQAWSAEMNVGDQRISVAQEVLLTWSSSRPPVSSTSDTLLSTRLRNRALTGKATPLDYRKSGRVGVHSRSSGITTEEEA